MFSISSLSLKLISLSHPFCTSLIFFSKLIEWNEDFFFFFDAESYRHFCRSVNRFKMWTRSLELYTIISESQLINAREYTYKLPRNQMYNFSFIACCLYYVFVVGVTWWVFFTCIFFQVTVVIKFRKAKLIIFIFHAKKFHSFLLFPASFPIFFFFFCFSTNSQRNLR